MHNHTTSCIYGESYMARILWVLLLRVKETQTDYPTWLSLPPRPIEFVRELFKSTPNLNNKDRKGALGYGMMGHFYGSAFPPPSAPMSPSGHIRSTSYSISYGRGKPMASPTAELKGERERER